MVLLLKNLTFTVVVTGLFVVWLPLRVFERHSRWPLELQLPHWFALVIAGFSVLAYLHCQWHFMHKGQGTPFLLSPPRKFVQRGLYRWVRNPMYIAVLAIIGAEALFLRSKHIGVYWLCLACLLQIVVAVHEERDLSFRFGAMYEDYRRAVSRWLPRPPRNLPSDKAASSREW